MASRSPKLVHVDDGLPGITRKKAGRRWAYFDTDGERITDREEIDRFEPLIARDAALTLADNRIGARAVLREPASELNFYLSEGKCVIDLKPLLPLNKGTELRSFARRHQLAGLLFAGDDRTDLDAVLEIARLRQDGLQAAAIVVQATDTLPALLEHADMVVQGVEGMARLLNQIVAHLRISPRT